MNYKHIAIPYLAFNFFSLHPYDSSSYDSGTSNSAVENSASASIRVFTPRTASINLSVAKSILLVNASRRCLCQITFKRTTVTILQELVITFLANACFAKTELMSWFIYRNTNYARKLYSEIVTLSALYQTLQRSNKNDFISTMIYSWFH